jgi:hypothetical protein
MKLEQVLGKAYYRIDKNQYDDTYLADMTIEELKILKTRVETKVQSLSAQIEAKKIEHSNGGKGSTPEWYINHKYALNMSQRMLSFLADTVKRRNRNERSVSDYFVDEARIYLDKGTFDTIMQNAVREKKILAGN